MRSVTTRLVPFVLVLALIAAACGDDADEAAVATSTTTTISTTTTPTTVSTTTTTTIGPEPLRINDLQVLGSHNSYHLRPEPDVYAAIELVSRELAESIDYSHRSLTEQLEEFGVRQFEIDVFADPDGGLYASRQALPVVGLPAESGLPELDEPGFKVLHTQDFDFGTTCLTLQLCLGEIVAWSDANPDHVPLMIMIELKEESVPAAAAASDLELPDLGIAWTEPIPTDAAVLDALDAELIEAVGLDRIIRPDDVRGERATLEEAVIADGWPTIEESRGMVMFAMVNTGAARDLYRVPSAILEGRVMFTTSSPGDPDAAFLRIDDPVDGAAEIARRAAEGYLIRTRTDSPTADARTGDTTRREAAVGSGAQYLSTDYYVADPSFGTGYVVDVPAVCNPVTAPVECDLQLVR
ncbi:MAG: Ca2+-dependent phosphoinositide-specific phospholipase C [Acidimicrobiales bacterium]